MSKKFSFKDRLMSFVYAFAGLKLVLRNEHNLWLHLSLCTVVVFLGLFLDVSLIDWCVLIICIGAVISAEIFNTAIEHIANFIQPEHDDRIRDIKDLGAAAVIFVAFTSLTVGMIIFIPKIISYLGL